MPLQALTFGNQDGLGPGISASNCASFMQYRCAHPEAVYNSSWTMSMNDDAVDQSIAAFLVARGPWSWIGYGWLGPVTPSQSPRFKLDVGEPTGNCTQPSTNVFTRSWSKGSATIDCNSFTATLAF